MGALLLLGEWWSPAADPIVMELRRSFPLARILSRLASAAAARSDMKKI